MSLSDGTKKLITILKSASTDTEKFAGLFMVTKLIKGKDCTTAAKIALFEAIGFDFLKRLLLTTDVPVDCPPSVYKSVACSVLTCFCNVEELATHPQMLENIPVFLDIVSQSDDADMDDNLILVGEAYHCLNCIASYGPGQKALLNVGAIAKMSDIYAQQSFQTDQALNILVKLAGHFGPLAWDNNAKSFHSLLNKIALDFVSDQSERKFELVPVLHALLFSCRRDVIGDSASDETWPVSLYKGLRDILQSKIGKTQRNPALILTSTVIDLLGIEWTLQDDEKPKVFFLLVLQLSAIEVRMLEGNAFNTAYKQADVLSACFIILEAAIGYLIQDVLELEQKEKQNVYTALKGAFTAIINILLKVSLDKSHEKFNTNERTFLYALIRVLVAWLAQETSALRQQIYKLLPFVLTIANETFYATRAAKMASVAEASGAELSDEQKTALEFKSTDILRLFLPALCHLTVEDEARKIMLAQKEDEVLYECVNYYWSIVNPKKVPIPKSERGKVKKVVELTAGAIEEIKDARTAIISLCNIFMNLTVLEMKVVEKSHLFNTLMKFIFNELPELRDNPDNLVLHANLSILGLLLLKQQSGKVRQNDFSICRYIQSTIRFLWDAYVVDESNNPNELVVAITYKEHWMELMELWFLGMQTMSAILSQIPWISEFAIESGWAEGIIVTLKKVKIGSLQPNIKSAYEDFLCQLVDANDTVVPVLKKADALKVCRNHRLMDLGKKLFGD